MTDRTTLCSAFQRTAAIDPEAVALRTAGAGGAVTWKQYASQVRELAAGFADIGVQPRDTVALLMSNRIEFYPVDVAIQHLGAVPFSVYNTSSAEQLSYILANARNRVVVCEAQYLRRIEATSVAIDHIVVLDEEVTGNLTLAELTQRGRNNTDFDFEAGWRAVEPDDLLTLVYTAGTTGDPKGVQLTHANLMHVTTAIGQILGVEFGDRITSFLPSAHIADRFTALYLQQAYGTQISTVADLRMLTSVLPDVRPTIWGAVPRIWEKIRTAILAEAASNPDPSVRAQQQRALDVAGKVGAARLAGLPFHELKVEYSYATERVLQPLLVHLGLDQVRWALSGAAPIPPQTLAFFNGIGVPITEIWGMSELSGIGTLTTPAQARLGTVGTLAPGMTARLAGDGELLVRGPLLMREYRNDPTRTDEAIDQEGWLHTGDIAEIDDGYLRIIDRKKELIITEAGKNISPVAVENAIKAATPLLAGVVAIGDARPYLTALLVLDEQAAADYAAQRSLDANLGALVRDPDLIATIATAVAEGNQRLSRAEQIKRFRLLPTTWEPGGDELTVKMSLKRGPIARKYRAAIEAMYGDLLAEHVYEPTDPARG
jgi:long-chain acyl-CoA synthetase